MSETLRGPLIRAIINAYHTTRLDSDYVPHILSKVRVQRAFEAYEAMVQPEAADALQASLEEVRRLREASTWQPIETAPKDGRYIIAGGFRPGGDLVWVKHSRWITVDEIVDEYGGPEELHEAGWTDGQDEDEPCVPTHWMPLPTPPQALSPTPKDGK